MKKKRYLAIAIGIIIINFILIILDDKLAFYKFDSSVGSMGFVLNKSAKSDIEGQMLWFAYNDTDIELNMNMLIDESEVGIYALTSDGYETVSATEMATKDKYIGSFVAYAPSTSIDINNDGTNDFVYMYAKTDTINTQGHAGGDMKFSNEKIPFEIVFKGNDTIVLYYNAVPLANTQVIVNSCKQQGSIVTTDENGVLDDVSLKEIKAGINVSYKTSDGKYYLMSYQPEIDSLFDNRHESAMKPIVVVVLISICIILVTMIIRNQHGILVGFKNYRFKDTIASAWDIIVGEFSKIRDIQLNFMTVRWIVMILSFVFFVYGSSIFGGWISRNVEIPTFACATYWGTALESSCYAFSHFDYLFGEHSTIEIVIFFISFFAFTIIFGRTLCGFVCPFGLIQDFIYEIRQLFRARGISFNERIYSILRLIKWQMLLFFLGAWTLGVNFCNFCPAIITTPAFAGMKLSLYVSGFLAVVVLVLGFFKRRIWCNVCPLGYMIGLFNKISLFKLKKNCQSCTECGACYEACPMGIKSIYTERNKIDITTSDCIMCGECIKKCPENDALAITFVNKKVYVASRFKFFNKNKKKGV